MADVYKQSFKQNYTNNIELSIFNCGLERCAPGQTWGPGIRDHYLIHLVVSGKGTFEVGGKTFEVVPGDLFFARPSQLIRYSADEQQPWVEGEPYAVYNEEGRVLLYTFHKYPDSYPDGTDVKLEWGNVWTFTGGELEDWYQENKEGVTDWQTRMKELLGLTPDNESNYVTAMWVKPEDVFRPAYISDIGTVEMTDSFSEDVDADYKEWFDANIISSYYDGEYPWTRLGYTYDWADNGQAYGLSEFIVKQDSDVKVAYTVELGEMIQKLEDNTWNPEAEN